MIAIVDYGMGNLKSVANAFAAIGRDARITSEAGVIRDAAGIVLPGVGAFGDGMRNLRARELAGVLTDEVVRRGKPFLGICLGMQFLARESSEHGRHDGLGWIPARVRRIEPAGDEFKVPHIGWNLLRFPRESELFRGLEEDPVYYFVHSYFVEVDAGASEIVTSTCWHGVEMVASVQQGNIYGVQFHPEKSQRCGIRLLENFVRLL